MSRPACSSSWSPWSALATPWLKEAGAELLWGLNGLSTWVSLYMYKFLMFWFIKEDTDEDILRLLKYRWSWTWVDQHFFSLPAREDVILTNHQDSWSDHQSQKWWSTNHQDWLPERRTVRTTQSASQGTRTWIAARVAGEKNKISSRGFGERKNQL